jgi:hypothetical protein
MPSWHGAQLKRRYNFNSNNKRMNYFQKNLEDFTSLNEAVYPMQIKRVKREYDERMASCTEVY